MNNKILTFIICFSVLSVTVMAQEFAVDENANIFSLTGSYIKQKGNLFNYDATNITFATNINHFFAKSFYMGAGFEYSSEIQEDTKSNGIGLGPQIGYVIGGPQSKALPFINFGIRYYRMNLFWGLSSKTVISGFDKTIGGGMIFPIKEHIGLIIEGGYHTMDLVNKDDDRTYSGTVFSIGAGLAGLLF